MRRLIIPVMALLMLAGCQPKGGEKLAVKDGWVRLPPVPGRPAAAYFTIEGAAKDDRLVRIDSAVVEKIELHESIMSGGVMTMRQLADVPVPAGAKIAFAPGGSHAMLFNVDARITPGTAIPMLFSFASGAKVEVEAKTVQAGEDGSSGDMGGMQH